MQNEEDNLYASQDAQALNTLMQKDLCDIDEAAVKRARQKDTVLIKYAFKVSIFSHMLLILKNKKKNTNL